MHNIQGGALDYDTQKSRAVTNGSKDTHILCRVGDRAIAVPIFDVEETLRPLATQTLKDTPDYVVGCAMIRGAAVPVVSGRRLLGLNEDTPRRWLTLKVKERRVALAVDEVVGIRDFTAASEAELPPLLQDQKEILSSLVALDAQLFTILGHARIIPDGVWTQLDQKVARS